MGIVLEECVLFATYINYCHVYVLQDGINCEGMERKWAYRESTHDMQAQ